MIYDDNVQWAIKKSNHFILKYPPNIYRDIEDLITICENIYNKISSFLGCHSYKLFIIYVCPDVIFCNNFEIRAPLAVPHQYCASILYKECMKGMLRGNMIRSISHEITHLLAYLWDNKMYHLEILEEGLATYLREPKINNYYMHYMMTKRRIKYLKSYSLKVKSYAHATNYIEAGSLVKFLVERYGIHKFKQLYISSALERKDKIFYFNGKKLSKNFLMECLTKIYNMNIKKFRKEWKKAVNEAFKNRNHFFFNKVRRIPGTSIFSTIDDE